MQLCDKKNTTNVNTVIFYTPCCVLNDILDKIAFYFQEIIMKTTRTFTLPLLLASSAVLTACGGGSDSSDTGGTGGNNTVALSASVVQSTVCNTTVPASTAELIVYDNNWAIKSRHKADASGKINASIPKTDYVNISFVGTDGVGSARRIDIDTYAQHPVGDLGVYTIPGASNQGCE